MNTEISEEERVKELFLELGCLTAILKEFNFSLCH
jgi:hypothetical protein